MALSIRLAQADDSPEAVDVIREVYEEYGFTWDPADYHADLYDLNRWYFDRGHLFWIAILDGRAVGTAALEKFIPIAGEPGKVVTLDGHQRVAGCDCALQRLYVRPGARRSGVGSSLFETVFLAATTGHCSAMEIWSDKRFEAAHRLYQRYGARVVGERICHDPDHSPEWGLILGVKQWTAGRLSSAP